MERTNSFEHSLSELDTEPVPYEPERHYLPIDNFKFDWNMMLYGEDETNNEIDWNKLVYGEDQMLEFDLKKNEKIMRPEYYNYMFRKSSEITDLEKYFLKQSGFEYELEVHKEIETVEIEKMRRFVIDNKLRTA
jgi:hypothetical protein